METGPDSPSTSPGTDVTTYDSKRNVAAQESHNGRISPPESPAASTEITPANVPATGLDTDEVNRVIVEVSSTLFGTVLRDHGSSGDHFTRFLAPKYLIKHEPSVTSAKAWAEADAVCPPRARGGV